MNLKYHEDKNGDQILEYHTNKNGDQILEV